MSDVENPTQEPEQAVEQAQECKAPAPAATGNGRIAILKHDLAVKSPFEEYPAPVGLDLAIRNISDSTIATAIFQAVLYDEEGNVLETVKHGEITLEPETSRAIRIACSPNVFERIKSYDVKIVRTTTADVEQVQLRRHENRTTGTGEEEIKGIVKNISRVKTDAAVVATFYDPEHENIGTKVVVLRNIEPNTIRQYELSFKPPEGDVVHSYTLAIGEIEG